MRIKSFKAWRPRADIVSQVACPPYDVLDSEEARKMAGDNPSCFLRVSKPEIELPPGTDLYSDAVYAKGAENFAKFKKNGWVQQEGQPLVYLYSQTMGAHTQLGLVCCSHIGDYEADLIKKHEKTRKAAEDDRTRITAALNANVGPVFLAYRDQKAIDQFFAPLVKAAPLYDFVANDGVRHKVWPVPDAQRVVELFAQVPVTYIADGHHRAASAVRVGAERRGKNPAHTGQEEYNWFLTVLFPASQLQILPYNRVVKDLNGRTPEAFLAEIKQLFTVQENADPKPGSPRHISMYLAGKWYGLSWPAESQADPVAVLDVSVLQNKVLAPLLAIDDPRQSKRIEFVGGIRGTGELQRRVDDGRGAVAFSMFPTTIEQLMNIADAGLIMPPKSTWFEPKLRTGLLVHDLE